MNAKPPKSAPEWTDPDDAREWTDDRLGRAEYAVGGKVLREAQGTHTRRRGRPKLSAVKNAAFCAAVGFDEPQGQSCERIGASQAAARIAMTKTRQKAASHSSRRRKL